MFKSGFTAVIGRPNVGKSTLLNEVIGEKLSIISDKPQTTRNRIQMIYTDDEAQIIFLDTPGIQIPKNKLGEVMLKLSTSTLDEVDLITFIVDNSMELGKLDKMIIEELKKSKTKIVLLINKIDLLTENEVETLKEKFEDMDMFEKIIAISALNNQNVDEYINFIKQYLEEGPMYFPEDMITDQPERFIIAEIIREKALIHLEDEIPHGIVVEIDKIKTRNNKNIIDVFANIYCEKDSHKGMVIGKNGQMIKKIGQEAREDIEKLLDTKVNLQLWIKVEKNWRERSNKVKYFGYR